MLVATALLAGVALVAAAALVGVRSGASSARLLARPSAAGGFVRLPVPRFSDSGVRVDAPGARYPLRIDPFVQQGRKLVGTGAVGDASPGLGWSVALSDDGDTALVGDVGDNRGKGAAWVFTRSRGRWSQQGRKLVGAGGPAGAQQGSSVALSGDGNTALVGGDGRKGGAVWVFTRSGRTWAQQGPKLVGTGAVGGSGQGSSVALSSDGDTALVGGYLDNSNAGAVWVFTRSGTTWTQQGPKLVGTGAAGPGAGGLVPGAGQGSSVALSSDGNTALVGGFRDNGGQGATWVFTRSGTTWTQQGPKLVGTGSKGEAGQGSSVALSDDGNTALVGGGGNVTNVVGAAWVFTRSGSTWTQQGRKLVGTGAAGRADQGYSVALSAGGNTALVGGFRDNGGKGATWVFTRSGTTWIHQGRKLVGTRAGRRPGQGFSVALSGDGNTALVGGPYANNLNPRHGHTAAGAVWVFVR